VGKAITLWAGLVGGISLEVFGQYGAETFTDPREVFDLHVRTLLEAVSNDPDDARN
jgi:hypothetical protein